MPCRSPITGYKDTSGKLTFNRNESLGRFGLLTFPCGVCRDCRISKSREWAIRCYHEAAMHERNCWLTLTFKHDPVTIAKRDIQVFVRALRQAGHSFSYYAVGEYGEKLSRPHYHVCLFGTDFEDKYAWQKSRGGLLYRSPQLEKYWEHGHALIAELTQENAAYTARYTMKKIGGEKAADHYVREYHGIPVNVHPEFALMSLKPPIGKRWIEKYYRDVFPGDFVAYKGKQYPVPRYYYQWLAIEHPELHERVREKRVQHFKDAEYISGKDMHQRAEARDARTKLLDNRNLGEASE